VVPLAQDTVLQSTPVVQHKAGVVPAFSRYIVVQLAPDAASQVAGGAGAGHEADATGMRKAIMRMTLVIAAMFDNAWAVGSVR